MLQFYKLKRYKMCYTIFEVKNMQKNQFYKKKTGPKSKRPDMKTLFDWRKSHSAEDCAKHFGVSRMTIYRWTKYYLQTEELMKYAREQL